MTSKTRDVDSKHGSTSRNASSNFENSSTGIVFDKDGKPCRVCTTFRNWTKQERKKQHSMTKAAGSIGMAILNSASTTSIPPTPQDCPPDVEQLGRATWTFLHTMAAYYPEVPSYEQQNSMKSFLTSFSQFYPCDPCAEHFRDEMKKRPPRVESRWALGKWICEMHNLVNEQLGKEIFDCNKIDERWKDGPKDGRCD